MGTLDREEVGGNDQYVEQVLSTEEEEVIVVKIILTVYRSD